MLRPHSPNLSGYHVAEELITGEPPTRKTARLPPKERADLNVIARKIARCTDEAYDLQARLLLHFDEENDVYRSFTEYMQAVRLEVHRLRQDRPAELVRERIGPLRAKQSKAVQLFRESARTRAAVRVGADESG